MSAIIDKLYRAEREIFLAKARGSISEEAHFMALSPNDVESLCGYIRGIESKAKLGAEVRRLVLGLSATG